MSKLTRTLIIGATLSAMHLVGMTAVAQAQANDDQDGKDARRPPAERQVGESWRQGQVASPEQTAADAALQRQLARVGGALAAGGWACQDRPARSLHPGRGGSGNLPRAAGCSPRRSATPMASTASLRTVVMS